MNYIVWANEYFDEAEIIKQKIMALKNSLKINKNISINETNRRISILYSMYLDCIHIAKTLKNKGEC